MFICKDSLLNNFKFTFKNRKTSNGIEANLRARSYSMDRYKKLR